MIDVYVLTMLIRYRTRLTKLSISYGILFPPQSLVLIALIGMRLGSIPPQLHWLESLLLPLLKDLPPSRYPILPDDPPEVTYYPSISLTSPPFLSSFLFHFLFHFIITYFLPFLPSFSPSFSRLLFSVCRHGGHNVLLYLTN